MLLSPGWYCSFRRHTTCQLRFFSSPFHKPLYLRSSFLNGWLNSLLQSVRKCRAVGVCICCSNSDAPGRLLSTGAHAFHTDLQRGVLGAQSSAERRLSEVSPVGGARSPSPHPALLSLRVANSITCLKNVLIFITFEVDCVCDLYFILS